MKKLVKLLTIALVIVISNNVSAQVLPESELSINHRPIGESLESILKLNPVKFEFNYKKYPALGLSRETQAGFQVAVVKPLFPETITAEQKIVPTGKNGHRILSTERVELTKLIPYLVQAIKEQQEAIRLLKEELQAVKSSVSRSK